MLACRRQTWSVKTRTKHWNGVDAQHGERLCQVALLAQESRLPHIGMRRQISKTVLRRQTDTLLQRLLCLVTEVDPVERYRTSVTTGRTMAQIAAGAKPRRRGR